VQERNTTNFMKRLRPRFAQVYRMFLTDGQRLSLTMNGVEIRPHDPLMLDEPGTTVEYDQRLDLRYPDPAGGERTESVRVRLVRLPAFSQETNRDKKINYPNQGFYLLRNNREIGFGSWYGVVNEKHPDLNRIRGEIAFSAVLDDLFGVDFTKQSPKFKQSVLDQLRQHLNPEINRLRNQLKAEKRIEADAEVSHDEAEKLIAQKQNLLPKTPIEIEKRERARRETLPEEQGKDPGKEPGMDPTNPPDLPTPSPRTPGRTHSVMGEPPCTFLTASLTPAGPIYTAELANGQFTVLYNRDHAFYERFVLDNRDKPSLRVATDFLIFAMVKAEYGYTDDSTRAVLEDIRATLSSVLRHLLS
jgi:hypothetical protein